MKLARLLILLGSIVMFVGALLHILGGSKGVFPVLAESRNGSRASLAQLNVSGWLSPRTEFFWRRLLCGSAAARGHVLCFATWRSFPWSMPC